MRLPGIISILIVLITAFISSGCKEQTREEHEFNETKKYANAGGYQAQMYLGAYYERGHGTDKDPHKAIQCYLRALEIIQEDKQKLPTTLEGWKKLAETEFHNNRIDYLLGLYYDGKFRRNDGEVRMESASESVVEDIKEARKWYERYVKDEWAVDALDAYMRLAELSESAEDERGYLTTASARGSAAAKYELAKSLIFENPHVTKYEKGKRRLAYHINETEVKFSNVTHQFYSGMDLMRQSSELGYSVASFRLYSIYSDWKRSSPLGRDEKLAWFYRRRYEEQSMSVSNLRLWLLSGNKIPSLAALLPYSKEGVETVLQYRIRALRGDPEALFALSVCLNYGQGMPRDTSEALRLCKKAAELGCPLALLSMGNRYYDGNGVIKDEIEAYACWNLAGIEIKEGGEYVSEMDKKLTESARLQGQKRSRELQAEIDAKKSKISRK